MREIKYIIPESYSGKKLIQFLRGDPGFSTGIVQTLRHTPGSVTRDGEIVRMIDLIFSGDEITVKIPDNSLPPSEYKTKLEIIYEDEDILVLNKPAGISVHPSHNHPDFTLANAVSTYLSESTGEAHAARPVGRLDKGTSGVIVFAKNVLAASGLNGKIEKIYIAIASTSLTGEGTIDAPIYRPDPGKTLRDVSPDGDAAVTHWKALSTKSDRTLLEIKIETGRTHQIRVHFKSIGAPLLGDDMYGGRADENINRPALHCAEAFFTHPVTDEKIHVSAPLPEDMLKAF